MAFKFKASYTGIGEMLRAPFMQAEMRARAEAIRDVAEAIAPVDESSPHPGRYKASFGVESGIRAGTKPRAYGRVYNTAPEALAVEYGTRNNYAHHTLMYAALAAGGGGLKYRPGTNTPRGEEDQQ